MPYWACMPASSGAPKWTLDNLRIEKALTGRDACRLAFGREVWRDDSKMATMDCGIWLVKNMGNRVAVLRSHKQKMALLNDREGWVDPYGYRLKLGSGK